MRYDAFISYSHGADGALAPAMQAALHRFAKPWWKLRAVNVFRDGTSLAAAHDLSEAIRTSLAQSRYFIFLANPTSAQSKWCQRELEYWIAEREPQNLLIVLTSGSILWNEATQDFDWSVTDALPRVLSGAFKAEPLWLDLAWSKQRSAAGEEIAVADPRFHQGVAMLAARLHGKSLDEIAGEDVRQHRRTRRIARAAVGALALLTVSSLAGAYLAVQGQRRAERNLDHALAATDTLVTDVADAMRSFYGVPRQQLTQMLGRVEAILGTLATLEDRPAILERRVGLMTTLARANFELGDLGRAEELLRSAEALITPPAERDGPASSAWQRLASVQEGMFDIARRRADHRDAEARSRRYRELADAMAAGLAPDTSEERRFQVLQAVVLAIERQKSAALDRGLLDQGLARAREAIVAADALQRAFPAALTARYQAALQRANLAEVLSALGRPDEALADLDAARAALVAEERGNANRLHILRALVQIEHARADILEGRDDWIAAVVVHENNVGVLRELQAADPKNAVLTIDLAQARRGLALSAARLGDTERARAEFAASAGLYAQGLAVAPDNIKGARGAVQELLDEASFLEDQNGWRAAVERLDRAVAIGDTLVRQRGADTIAVLTAVQARAARARLANFDGRGKDAIKDLERGEQLIADAGRPSAPSELRLAAAIVADLAQQWGYAGQLPRSLQLVDDALELYTPPEGLSDAASVSYRAAVARLLQQKATAELDGGNRDAALAAAERAVALYEDGIIPYTRHGWALDGYVRQHVQLARVAYVAGAKARSRDVYCAIASKIGTLAPVLIEKPRLRLAVLETEFNCAHARLLLGEPDKAETLATDLASRIDASVPIDATLMTEWRLIRARIARLRSDIAVIAGTPEAAARLRTAIRYYEEAVKVPTPESRDLADLAFLQGQLADLLDESGDRSAARLQMEGAIATWQRAIRLNRIDYTLELKLAEATMALADLWEKDDREKAYRLYLKAIDMLAGLPPRLPAQGRPLFLPVMTRAQYGAADAAFSLDRFADSVQRHRQALALQEELARLAKDDIAVQLDLARQHARLARALHGAKSFAAARAETAQAHSLLQALRKAAPDGPVVDRLIAWTERMRTAIAEDEHRTAASPVEEDIGAR